MKIFLKKKKVFSHSSMENSEKVKFISFVDAKNFSIALSPLISVNDPHAFYYSEWEATIIFVKVTLLIPFSFETEHDDDDGKIFWVYGKLS